MYNIYGKKNTTLFIKQDAVFSSKGFDMLSTAEPQLELSGRKTWIFQEVRLKFMSIRGNDRFSPFYKFILSQVL